MLRVAGGVELAEARAEPRVETGQTLADPRAHGTGRDLSGIEVEPRGVGCRHDSEDPGVELEPDVDQPFERLRPRRRSSVKGSEDHGEGDEAAQANRQEACLCGSQPLPLRTTYRASG